ncbi:MAG: hypothetical protein NC123_10370 [Butyrivibrio sp.]|nr:hypothetical protein [Acetatifactor muris]MCM1559933.1 hypothetical protein [Butyrivibrio sp.]
MQKIAAKKKDKANFPRAYWIISLIAGEIAIVILCSLFLSLYIRSMGIKPIVYSDGMMLLPIICMVLVILTATGLLKEFGCALAYCVKDSGETVAQVRKAAFSIKLSMITAFLTGTLLTIVTAIGLLHSLSLKQPEFFMPLMANAGIGVLYGIMAVILMLPIYARLKTKILTKE